MGMAVCSIAMVLVPVILLLTLSFFVLLALSNVKTQGLKVFGYVIVAFLWLAALLAFSGGIYRISKGMFPGMHMRKAMMEHQRMGQDLPEKPCCSKMQER